MDDFPEQLVELFGYFDGAFPEGHPYRHITATPGLGYRPAVWLLGSSDYSAQAAGMLGLPFSFAHHFGAGGLPRGVPPLRAPGQAPRDAPAARLRSYQLVAEAGGLTPGGEHEVTTALLEDRAVG